MVVFLVFVRAAKSVVSQNTTQTLCCTIRSRQGGIQRTKSLNSQSWTLPWSQHKNQIQVNFFIWNQGVINLMP